MGDNFHDWANNKNWEINDRIRNAEPLGGGEWSPNLHDPNRFVNDSSQESQDDEKEEKSSDDCYIATATLGHQANHDLVLLRAFRDNIVGASNIGKRLINYYRKTAPEIAEYISSHPHLKSTFRIPFIQPSLSLLHGKHSPIKDIFVYLIFLSGLAWAEIIRWYISLTKRQI